MAYIPINNTQVDPDSPVTAELMTALRDNPLAIAAGEAGAPRIARSAMGLMGFAGAGNFSTTAGVGTDFRIDVGGSARQAVFHVHGIAVGGGGTSRPIRIRMSGNGGTTWTGWTTLFTVNDGSPQKVVTLYIDRVNGSSYLYGATVVGDSGPVSIGSGPFNAIEFGIASVADATGHVSGYVIGGAV